MPTLALSALMLGSAPALACSLALPEELVVDATLADDEAPMAPELLAVIVDRGQGPRSNGIFGGKMQTSCDDIGFLTIVLDQPGDDDAAELGYRLELVDGELPDGMVLPELPLIGPDLFLHWGDGATHDQELVDFTLALTPVDLAGNEGPAIDVDVVDDPSGAGCSTAGALGASGWLVLALAGLARRRS